MDDNREQFNRNRQRIKDDQARREHDGLKEKVAKKITTTMIGAIDQFEKEFRLFMGGRLPDVR